MAVHLPTVGFGIALGGISPLVAPIVAPIADVVSDNVPVGSGSVYLAIGGILGLIVRELVPTILKERGTVEKLKLVSEQHDESIKQIKALEVKIVSLEARVAAKDANEADLVRKLADLAERHTKLADRNYRLSGMLLTALGRIKPMADRLHAAEVAQNAARPRILLLEDDDNVRLPMTEILESFGFDVVAVESVSDARDELDTRAFDAAILDLMVSDGDGADILRAIRDRELPTTVIVTTGKADVLLGPVRAMQPDHLLKKPIDMELVARLINEASGGKGPAGGPANGPPVK